MKRVAILQSNYIPWKGYFDLLHRADVFIVYDEVQYTKNDWRNRNQIKTPTGPTWITIPVRQESLHQRIRDTRITQRNWNVKHWNSLKMNYARAPCFREYEAVFHDLYAGPQSEWLSEVNLRFLRAINGLLGIGTQLIDSSELNLEGDRNERLVDAVRKVGGTHYLSGPAARAYLDVSLFERHGLVVEWMDYGGYPVYRQLHPPFVHSVSVLDLIFNEGREAPRFIWARREAEA